jgi:4,5-DOPA dioxygenase extradiol
MKFPTVFVNHGGGPLPLLGRQPALVQNMKDIRQSFLPEEDPKAIVVLSAHWESDPIQITSSHHPKMYYDYHGFPAETYEYDYPAPGSPDLAERIQNLLGGLDLKSELDHSRGFDHGVFIPLMIMYPEATIPVVCVSMHASLDATVNMKIGSALASLRDEGILIMGSGYSFHNMQSFFNPSQKTVQASVDFNQWLKDTILGEDSDYLQKLKTWDTAPGARLCHPREEHLVPLFMVAAAAGDDARPILIYDTTTIEGDDPLKQFSEHAVTGYLFQ